MLDDSRFITVKVLFLVVGFNDISDITYFIVVAFSTGAPLKYQVILGIGVPVAWQVKKAVSPSFSVWSATPISITAESSQRIKKLTFIDMDIKT